MRSRQSKTPAPFKELTPDQARATDGWKTAEPKDDAIRGKWWEMFGDTNLNALEEQVGRFQSERSRWRSKIFSRRAPVVKQARSEFFRR